MRSLEGLLKHEGMGGVTHAPVASDLVDENDSAVIQFNNGGTSVVTLGEGMLSYTLAANGVSAVDNLASGGTLRIGSDEPAELHAAVSRHGLELAVCHSQLVRRR